MNDDLFTAKYIFDILNLNSQRGFQVKLQPASSEKLARLIAPRMSLEEALEDDDVRREMGEQRYFAGVSIDNIITYISQQPKLIGRIRITARDVDSVTIMKEGNPSGENLDIISEAQDIENRYLDENLQYIQDIQNGFRPPVDKTFHCNSNIECRVVPIQGGNILGFRKKVVKKITKKVVKKSTKKLTKKAPKKSLK